MAKDANLNSASILLGSLKKESVANQIATQPIAEQPVQVEQVPTYEPRNKIMREGDDFVVRVVEKRKKKKNFMFPETLEAKFAKEAADLNVSQNELIVQILQQRYKD